MDATRIIGTLSLVLLAACRQQTAGDEQLAMVNGRPILLAELQSRADRRFAADPDARVDDVLTEELDWLVDRRVVLNRALDLGLKVAEPEVEDRIRLVHGDGFAGDTPVYREEVRREMLVERTEIRELVPQIHVPESQLADYYERLRPTFSHPERVQIRQIVVEDVDRAAELRRELAGGADFALLAKAHSLGPESADGGVLRPYARGELPEIFDQAFLLKAGELSAVMESPHGYHIFLLIERLPPQAPELGELRDTLLAQLVQERMGEFRPQWLRELRREAEIQVNERLLEIFER